tara:strand:+ start:4073 stop:4525 length:453 start_codon:yes stop_codon:yes gene_type:complete
LGYGKHQIRHISNLRRQTGAFLPEDQNAVLWQGRGLYWLSTRKVIDANDRQFSGNHRRYELVDSSVVFQMLVTVGDHRTASVPFPVTNNVHCCCQERVGISDNCADVQIMLPVFDGDMEGMASPVQVFDNSFATPIPVLVYNVSAVPISQ